MSYTTAELSRYWAKVDKSAECWVWTAGVSNVGYGAFWHNKQMQKAHRISYELHYGPIKPGMWIDHACHNRLCVNPDHLREVTPKQNTENHAGMAHANSKSGVRGVVWVKDCSKWGVYVSHLGKSKYYGVYESIAQAEAVAIQTRNSLFTHNDRDRVAA